MCIRDSGKPAGAQFPQTAITPRRKNTPLAETEDGIEALLDSVPDFAEVFESARKTPGEVQQMLDEFLLGEEDAEDVSSETTKYESDSSTSAVDKAFEELLGS